MRTHFLTGLIASLLAGQASAATFTDLGVDGISLTSLSVNGHIASGVLGTSAAWRWDQASGVVPMSGFRNSYGMNSYAQPIVGAYGAAATAAAAEYFSNSAIVGVDPIPADPTWGQGTGQGVSTPYGVSDAGVVVGLAYSPTNVPIAFTWSTATGWQILPVNRPQKASRANGISKDGSTIFGWNDQTTGYRSGVIWRNGQTIDMVDSSGNPVGEALGASADGRVVVGYNYNTANGQEAWRWTEETGVVPIGVMAMPNGNTKAPAAIRSAMQQQQNLPSEQRDARLQAPDGFFFPQALAIAVSDDGHTIVGGSGIPPQRSAVIWTDDGANMQLLSDYAAAHGVTIPAGLTLLSANGISADGLTIGGYAAGATNYRSYIIDFHPPAPQHVTVQAFGRVDQNNLNRGPFAAILPDAKVLMTFQLSTTGTDIAPGQDTSYAIVPGSFVLHAGRGVDTLAANPSGVTVDITNDFPMSDGIHLFSTPTSAGQVLEFELFNPGGNLFDSTDINNVNRTFGPEFFEKMAWDIQDGNRSMTFNLEWVSVTDAASL
jgi:uncharacterized membrane protein